MRMLMVTVIAVAVVATSAEAQPKPAADPGLTAAAAKARQTLDRKLLDYPAARFRDVSGRKTPAGNGYVFCGFVNSKNRMGAYVGWEGFYSLVNDDGASLVMKSDGEIMSDLVDTVCKTSSGPDQAALLTFR